MLLEPLPGFVPRRKQLEKLEATLADQEMALFMKAAGSTN